ncbi:MAG: sugar-binding protein [Planctomycetota bacterium]
MSLSVFCGRLVFGLGVLAMVGLTGCGGGAGPDAAPSGSAGSTGPGSGSSTAAAPGAGGSGAESGATENGPATKTAAGKRPRVAYVTNGVASFWTIAQKGAEAAGRDLDCDVDVKMPTADSAVANQKRILEELISAGTDGIAVSPIDPDNQTEILNTVADATNLITHDADAPKSKRLAYIGMDNYLAGRMCGQLVKEAMPDGGSLMIFVGRLEQLNAKLRRQGLIDELLDRSIDNTRYDAPGEVIKGEKYTILDTRTDNFDFAAAKALAEDAIAKHDDLGCMVGLFAYNPPYILEALTQANKLGKIKVVAFDEDDKTLQAILDGHCFGTVVQNPYQYGYQSVKMLQALARGDKAALPADGFMNIDARKIVKANAAEFWEELKKLTQPGDAK